MTDEEAKEIGSVLARGTREFVAKQLAPLLERIAVLESKPSIEYQGVYEAGKAYGVGAAVTYEGSVWIARQVTAHQPGTAASGWQLAVKRGKAGRDAR